MVKCKSTTNQINTNQIIDNLGKDGQIEEFLRDNFMPNLTVIMKNSMNQEELNIVAPFTKDYTIQGERAYYLCEKRSCRAPVNHIEDLKKLLTDLQ